MLAFLKRIQFLLLIGGVMFIALAFGDELPTDFKAFFYTASSLMREVLLFILPFLVLPFLLSSIILLKSRGLQLIMGILGLIFVSNMTAILAAYGLALPFMRWLHIPPTGTLGPQETLLTWATLDLPQFVTIEHTLIVGLLLGLILSARGVPPRLLESVECYRRLSEQFLSRVFIPLLPIYIFGVLLQVSYQSDFMGVFGTFGRVILLVAIIQVLYTLAVFLIGCGGDLARTSACIRRSLPAGFLGFSSMSSVVTMPVTLRAAEANLQDPLVARIAVTSTVNIHVLGDCLSLPILAVTVYLMHFGHLPPFETYLVFAFFLALAQFTAVSIPGGSIVVMTPFLISKLGYSAEMVGLITGLSIFFEPLGTAFNVMGNSGFALIIQRLLRLTDKSCNKSC